MNLELLERRREMAMQIGLHFPLQEIVKSLSTKFNVSERQVYADYESRKKWLGGILQIEDAESFTLDVLASHKEIARLAFREFLRADNSNARIGALNLMRALNLDLISIFILPKLEQKVDVEGEVNE